MKKEYTYIIEKFVVAENIQQALEKEKDIEVSSITLTEVSKNSKLEDIQPEKKSGL